MIGDWVLRSALDGRGFVTGQIIDQGHTARHWRVVVHGEEGNIRDWHEATFLKRFADRDAMLSALMLIASIQETVALARAKALIIDPEAQRLEQDAIASQLGIKVGP